MSSRLLVRDLPASDTADERNGLAGALLVESRGPCDSAAPTACSVAAVAAIVKAAAGSVPQCRTGRERVLASARTNEFIMASRCLHSGPARPRVEVLIPLAAKIQLARKLNVDPALSAPLPVMLFS